MEAVLESLEALELGDKELAQALLMSLDDSISSSSDSEDADMAAAVAASLEDQDTADADLAQAIKASLADEKAKGKQPATLEKQMAQLTLTASSNGASSSSGAMLAQLGSSWPVIAEQYVSLHNAVSQGDHSVGVMSQLLQLSEMIPAALQLQPGSPALNWVQDRIADLLGKVMTGV
jgi:nucleoid-associated protein YgaU